MSHLAIARAALVDCLRSGRLWLVQFFANPILLALFTAWLLIPVASIWHVAVNVVAVAVLLVAALILHAGTLNFFSDRQRGDIAPLLPAFRRALRHLAAITLCVAVFCLLWLLVDKLETYQSTLPAYIRSTLPAFLRRHIPLSVLDALFSAVLFLARWTLAPGLVLPLLLQTADRGFRGFGFKSLFAWTKTVFSFGYWLVLLVASLLGVFATQKLMAWTPDFKTSTLHSESVSLAVRLSVAYLFALFSWLLTCSLMGRYAAADRGSSDVSRNPAA